MKKKESTKENELLNFLQSNEFNFSRESEFYKSFLDSELSEVYERNDEKNLEKYQENSKKSPQNKVSNLKFAKNVIKAKRGIERKNNKKEKKNSKIIQKCNDQLIVETLEEKEIYLTIDKFNRNGKKTIVYFIDSFFPVIDGVVAVLDNYAQLMQKYYNVVICAPKHNKQRFKTDKYFVLQADSMYIKKQGYDLGFPQFDFEFQKYISMLKIDLIHLQSPFNMGNFGLALAKRRRIPCLTSFHSQFKQNFYSAVKNDTIATWLTKILLYVYQRSDYVLTMNDYAKKVIREYGLKKPVRLIPNATNLKKKEFDEEYENQIIARHKIDKSKFNLIFIGRFVEVKNVYFILDVVKDLFEINKDFNFIFLGYGPEQSKMQKFVKENGLENIVKFTGKIDSVDEKAVIIKNSDLLFFPSIYDTDGIVKIECACYSVPTLTIEDTGVAANMTNNHNAFIEKYDKKCFVDRLNFLIKNVDLVKKVGENANLEVYITWEDVCERLKNLYEDILKTHDFKKAKKKENKKAKNA